MEGTMPRKILLADDDSNTLKLYTLLFENTDYALTTTLSYTVAASLISANHYDLLVTDLKFPDGLGTELIKLFEEKRAGARSLLVTGVPDAAGMIERAATTGYLAKPFEPRQFLSAVTDALKD